MNDVAAPDLYGVLDRARHADDPPPAARLGRARLGLISPTKTCADSGSPPARWTSQVGAPFELVWRNDELTSPPGERPPVFSEEHRMQGRITECDPPHKLAYEWPGAGHVMFELQPIHTQDAADAHPSPGAQSGDLLGVSAGWHAHLDLLAVRIADGQARPFWDEMARLRKDYDRRIPA